MLRAPIVSLRQATVVYSKGLYRYILPLQGEACICKGVTGLTFTVPATAFDALQPATGPLELLLSGQVRAVAASEPLLVLEASASSLVSELQLK